MQRVTIVLAAISLIVAIGGCGSAEPPKPAAEKVQRDPSSPEQVVYAFLDAVRTDDAEKATSLLSSLARERTAEKGATITPPSSKTASFKVGQVEIIGQGGAHVASTWTDRDEEGKPHTDNVIWIVREEDEGWRIVGMVTKVFPDQPPLIQNFEDPDDMLRKQQLVQQEMERRAQGAPGVEKKAAAGTAQGPAKPAPSENPLRR